MKNIKQMVEITLSKVFQQVCLMMENTGIQKQMNFLLLKGIFIAAYDGKTGE